jgi:SAM-dependent methyltransferase
MTSSLPYWEKRWGAAPSSFDASWPDYYARGLELLCIRKYLPEKGRVVELGCGNFQLAESAPLVDALRGRYVGIDGSAVAIQAAKDRKLAGMEFRCIDLAAEPERTDLGDFVLTKRFLQNLVPAARAPLIRRIFEQYAHGLLIEDCAWARSQTDAMRRMVGREALAVPEFNWSIQLREVWDGLQARGGDRDPFMGWFYGITRVFPELPPSGFDAAFHLSQRAILNNERQPLFGPVIALRW